MTGSKTSLILLKACCIKYAQMCLWSTFLLPVRNRRNGTPRVMLLVLMLVELRTTPNNNSQLYYLLTALYACRAIMAAATIAGAASRAGRVTPEEVDDIPSASNATKGGMPRQQQRRRKSNPGHLDDVIRAEAGMRGDLVLAKYGFAGAPTMETQEESEAAAWEEHAAAYSIGPLASTLSPCHEAVVTGAGEEDASGETNPPSLAPVPRAKSCRAEEWPLFYDAATHEQFREKADPIRDEDALPRDDGDARNWLPESLRSRGDGNAAEAAAAAAEERMNVDGNKMEVNAARPLKCAVVGNSGVLHGLRLGREIDSHDVVFRINQAPTRTRRISLGRKPPTCFCCEKTWFPFHRKGCPTWRCAVATA